MDVWLLRQDGEVVRHRHLPAAPAPFLKAVAPERDGLVVAVACLCTWDGLADLGAPAGLPLVLGQALYRKAIHGGKATNDQIDSQNIALLLRGGMLPHASGYPAALRAPRDLLRRRLPLTRPRAALLAHVQHTNSQSHWPEIGQKLAYKAHRDGVAARVPAPAVQQHGEVALALIDVSDQVLHDGAWTLVRTAK
jgi:hypothetical protein